MDLVDQRRRSGRDLDVGTDRRVPDDVAARAGWGTTNRLSPTVLARQHDARTPRDGSWWRAAGHTERGAPKSPLTRTPKY